MSASRYRGISDICVFQNQSFELLRRRGRSVSDVLRQAEFKRETQGMRRLITAAREELGMEVLSLSLSLTLSLSLSLSLSPSPPLSLSGTYVVRERKEVLNLWIATHTWVRNLCKVVLQSLTESCLRVHPLRRWW